MLEKKSSIINSVINNTSSSTEVENVMASKNNHDKLTSNFKLSQWMITIS